MNQGKWRATSGLRLITLTCLLALIAASVSIRIGQSLTALADQQPASAQKNPPATSEPGQSAQKSPVPVGALSRTPLRPGEMMRRQDGAKFIEIRQEEFPSTGQQIKGEPGTATRKAEIDFSEIAREEAAGLIQKVSKPKKSTVRIFPVTDPHPDNQIIVSPPAAIMAPQGEADRKLNVQPRVPSPELAANFQALGDSNTGIPPDTHGAAGPNHLMVTLNTDVRIQDKTGRPLSTSTLGAFWGRLGNLSTFDPKILYDSIQNRWIFVTMADPLEPTAAMLIGVSQTDDPTGRWNLYLVQIDSNGQNWADYPSIGFNKDWIVVSCNIFPNQGGSFRGSNIYVFNKADLYANGTGKFTLLRGPDLTPCPAITQDANLATLFVVTNLNSAIKLSTITGAVGAEVLTQGPTISGGSDTWAFATSSDIGPQKGTSVKLDTGFSWMQNVVYRNGTLWAAQTVNRPASNPTRSGLQLWNLSTGGSVLQRIIVEDPTNAEMFCYPTVAVNKNSDMLIGYSRLGADEFASAHYRFRGGTDALNTLRDDTLLKVGEAPYDKTFGGPTNRWGDYSSTIMDPNDLDMWTIQEYAVPATGGFDRWATWWGRVNAPQGSDTAAPTVQLTSPNGGEKLTGSNKVTISWTSSDNSLVLFHDLDLSTDGGTTFATTVASGVVGTAKTFEWTVPLVESTQARVRVTAADPVNNRASDASDASFTISRPALSPPTELSAAINGPQVRLSWKAAANTPGASLTGYSIYRSRTSPVAAIGSNRLGTFPASLLAFSDRPNPADGKTQFFYVVTAMYNTGESAPSNEVSAIPEPNNDTTPPQVKVVAPNGGETVNNGEPLQIQWQSSDPGGGLAAHNVDLSLDGGTTFGTSVAAGLGATAQSFVFQIPTTIASATARIRVTARDAAGNNGIDSSDANFTIKSNDTSPPTVTITSPTAGQKAKITASAGFNVTWSTADNVGVTSQEVFLAKDGATFQSLASGLSGSTTSFTLTQALAGPKGKNKAAKVRVVAKDAAGNSGTGDSGAFKLIVK